MPNKGGGDVDMNIVRNILAVIVGIVIGSIMNGATLAIGNLLVPQPAGFDNSTIESIARTAHLLQPVNFIVVFMAHAVGTFAGVLAAMFIAANGRSIIAIIVGMLFLTGGIAASLMIPAPVWFVAADLICAYLPMAFLARKVSRKP